jgi:streptogramin lyase
MAKHSVSRFERFAARSRIVLLASLVFSMSAQEPLAEMTATHFVGSEGGAGNDDGAAPRASFVRPGPICRGSDGSLFVADNGNFTIRKIDPLGNVATVAGLAGSTGDADGKGAAARFREIFGITAAADGTLFVTEDARWSYNHKIGRIRKILPDGTTSTVATGLSHPRGILAHPSLDLFVADEYTIRRIQPDGTVSVVAGGAPWGYWPTPGGPVDGVGAAAKIRQAGALALAPDGRILFSDFYSLRYLALDGTVQTWAYSMAGTHDGPIATAGLGSRIFALAFDAAGALWFLDGTDSVRRLSTDGIVSTIAGSLHRAGWVDGGGAAARFYEPIGLAFDDLGRVWISDSQNHTIRRLDPGALTVMTVLGSGVDRRTVDGPCASARFVAPTALVPDGVGGHFVLDGPEHVVRRISAGCTVTTFAGSPGESGYVDGPRDVARFSAPEGIGVRPDGDLLVSDTWNRRVRIVRGTGDVSTLAGGSTNWPDFDGIGPAATVWYPESLICDKGGVCSFVDRAFEYQGNSLIRSVSSIGAVQTLIGPLPFWPPPPFGYCRSHFDVGWRESLAVAPDSGLWLTSNLYLDPSPDTILSLGPDGMVERRVGSVSDPPPPCRVDGPALDISICSPSSLFFDSAGDLLFAELWGPSVRKASSGYVTTLAGGSGEAGYRDGTGPVALFDGPGAIVEDGAGGYFVADTGNACIRRLTPAAPDRAAIDLQVAPAGQPRVLFAANRSASATTWRIVRRPATSSAEPSSLIDPSITFTPDVDDLWTFELDATGPLGRSISRVSLWTGSGPMPVALAPAERSVAAEAEFSVEPRSPNNKSFGAPGSHRSDRGVGSDSLVSISGTVAANTLRIVPTADGGAAFSWFGSDWTDWYDLVSCDPTLAPCAFAPWEKAMTSNFLAPLLPSSDAWFDVVPIPGCAP